MDDQNNWRHGKFSLERKWATKFWTNREFVRYLTVLEVNTALASGPFKNDGLVQPSLGFWTALAMECLEKKIGFKLGDIEWPKRGSKIPIYVSCEKITVRHHGRMWHPKQKWNRNIKSRSIKTIQKVVKRTGYIASVPRVYFYALDALQTVKLRGWKTFS